MWQSIIPLAISLYGQMQANKDKNNGNVSSTTTNTPADWSSLGGGLIDQGTSQQWIPEQRIPGSGTGDSYDPSNPGSVIPGHWETVQNPAKPVASQIWEDALNQMFANGTMDNKMAGFGPLQSKAINELTKSITGANKTYGDVNNQATANYIEELAGLRSPSFQMSVGGQNFGVVPKRNAMLADMAANVYGARTSNAATQAQLAAANANQIYDQTIQTSPMLEQLAGFSQLWPYLKTMQEWRFGLPSSTTNETASYNPSITEQIGSVAKNTQTLTDLWNSLNNNSYNNSYYSWENPSSMWGNGGYYPDTYMG